MIKLYLRQEQKTTWWMFKQVTFEAVTRVLTKCIIHHYHSSSRQLPPVLFYLDQAFGDTKVTSPKQAWHALDVTMDADPHASKLVNGVWHCGCFLEQSTCSRRKVHRWQTWNKPRLRANPPCIQEIHLSKRHPPTIHLWTSLWGRGHTNPCLPQVFNKQSREKCRGSTFVCMLWRNSSFLIANVGLRFEILQ